MKIQLLIAAAALLGAGPASSMHREEIPVVMQLAHDLEERATHVAELAERQAHHFTGQERRMIRSLRHFAAAAARLHDSVEGYFTSPDGVDQEIEHLNEDADSVEDRIYRSHALSHVVRDWDQCALVLRQLNRYFGSPHAGGRDEHAPYFTR